MHIMHIENLTINIAAPAPDRLLDRPAPQASTETTAQKLDPLNVNLSPEINEVITRLTDLLFGYEAATEPVDEP